MEAVGSSVFTWYPGRKTMLVTASTGVSLGGGGLFMDDNEAAEAEQGKIIIYDVNLAEGKLVPKVTKEVGDKRFERLEWGVNTTGKPFGDKKKYEYGIVAGILNDGTLQMWNVDDMMAGSPSEEGTIKHKQGNITCMDFLTKTTPACIATGGSDGHIAVWQLKDLKNPLELALNPQHLSSSKATITDVKFNPSRNYLLAAATGTGFVMLWDLRSKNVVLQVGQGFSSFTTLTWTPHAPCYELVVGTASGGYGPSPIHVWDVHADKHMPKAVLEGHNGGIVSVSWSAQDPNLLVATANDGRMTMWNPHGTQGNEVIQELPAPDGRNIKVQWHPSMPLLASCGTSGPAKLKVHSMHSIASGSGATGKVAAPGWLKRPVGASFALGGQLVCHSSKKLPEEYALGDLNPCTNCIAIEEDTTAVKRVQDFQTVIGSPDADLKSYCKTRSNCGGHPLIDTAWAVISSQLPTTDARDHLLEYLNMKTDDIFKETTGVSPEEADLLAKKSLLIADFDSAQKWLLCGGRIVDALVLTSYCSNGNALIAAKDAYYNSLKAKTRDPSSTLIEMVQIMVEGSVALDSLLEKIRSKTATITWKEALSLITVRANGGDELKAHCKALGDALAEVSAKDAIPPLVCYLSAGDVDSAAKYLIKSLSDSLATHIDNLVELVSVFSCVTKVICMDETFLNLQCKYAMKLSNYGKDGIHLALTQFHWYGPHEHEATQALRWRLCKSHPNWSTEGMVNPFPDFVMQKWTPEMEQMQKLAIERAAAEAAAAAAMPVHQPTGFGAGSNTPPTHPAGFGAGGGQPQQTHHMQHNTAHTTEWNNTARPQVGATASGNFGSFGQNQQINNQPHNTQPTAMMGGHNTMTGPPSHTGYPARGNQPETTTTTTTTATTGAFHNGGYPIQNEPAHPAPHPTAHAGTQPQPSWGNQPAIEPLPVYDMDVLSEQAKYIIQVLNAVYSGMAQTSVAGSRMKLHHKMISDVFAHATSGRLPPDMLQTLVDFCDALYRKDEAKYQTVKKALLKTDREEFINLCRLRNGWWNSGS